jgi:hypothetical protein
MVFVLKKSSSKTIVYTCKHFEQLLNKKYNWCSLHAQKIFEKQNPNLFKIFTTIMKSKNYEFSGYDLLLILQEAKEQEEGFILSILRDMKERISECEYLFNFVFDYENDHGNHIYNDLFIDQEYNHHTVLMLATKKNFMKITKFLMNIHLINTKVESYNQYTKCYESVYTYAMSNQNYDLLNRLLIRDAPTFWKFTRTTPESLYTMIQDKSLPLIDTILMNHCSSDQSNGNEFQKNSIYMELAMGLNQKSVCTMIDIGEINPFYIERQSGNSALISAVFTKNIILFDKLMDMAPLWYVLHKNIDGKSAIDYVNSKSKNAIVQHMYQRLHSTIKIGMERPKVIIMNGKDTIYINPQESV